MFRMCIVCQGKGNLWTTPKLLEGNPIKSSNPSKYPLSSPEDPEGGLTMPCWKCLGKKVVQDNFPTDVGEATKLAKQCPACEGRGTRPRDTNGTGPVVGFCGAGRGSV